ncbi:MAG: hypothetical protein J5954_01600 [Prevotella sp.]|nr:hypothetical protein [Prevotella sp.]
MSTQPIASGPERWWCRFATEEVALCDPVGGTLWPRKWHFVNNKLGGGEAQNGTRETTKPYV